MSGFKVSRETVFRGLAKQQSEIKIPTGYILQNARDAIRHTLDYTTEGKEIFLTDRKTQDAVVRNLQVIGEAIKQLSGTVKQSHPDIPWKSIAGMRDKLIQDYFGINLELVWEVVEKHLPPSKQDQSVPHGHE